MGQRGFIKYMSWKLGGRPTKKGTSGVGDRILISEIYTAVPHVGETVSPWDVRP